MENAILFHPEKGQSEVAPANGTNFTLKELYKLIECDMIEVAYLNNEGNPNDPIMICDEEGLFKSAALLNVEASQIYNDSWGLDMDAQGLVGIVLMCPSKMLK